MGDDSRRTDPATGLPLVAAAGRTTHRIARLKHGPVDPPQRLPVVAAMEGNVAYPRSCWSRFDVEGRTLYLGETAQTAYAEALGPFKRLGARGADAAFMGLDDIDDVPDQDWPRWRADRRIWSVGLPEGWFIDVAAGASLAYLERVMGGRLRLFGVPSTGLTTAHLLGEDRRLTTAIADALYDAHLDGDGRALGVTWESKRGWGRNYALWLRPGVPVALGISPARLITADDEDLAIIAKAYRLAID